MRIPSCTILSRIAGLDFASRLLRRLESSPKIANDYLYVFREIARKNALSCVNVSFVILLIICPNRYNNHNNNNTAKFVKIALSSAQKL